MIVKIPIKPHLLNYLRTRYRFNDHYRWNSREWLSKIILLLLYRKNDSRKITPFFEKNLEEGYTFLPVDVSKSTAIRKIGFIIPYERRFFINDIIESQFREELFRTMIRASDARKAMEEFLKNYRIDEEMINFDSLYRDYIRRKSKFKKAK